MNNEPQEHEEVLDFTKPDFTFLPKGYHLYRQRGPYLVCTSCEVQHAVWIGVDKILVGFNEKNEPIIQEKVMGA